MCIPRFTSLMFSQKYLLVEFVNLRKFSICRRNINDKIAFIKSTILLNTNNHTLRKLNIHVNFNTKPPLNKCTSVNRRVQILVIKGFFPPSYRIMAESSSRALSHFFYLSWLSFLFPSIKNLKVVISVGVRFENSCGPIFACLTAKWPSKGEDLILGWFWIHFKIFFMCLLLFLTVGQLIMNISV